jgi:nicotinamide-nucleotide amidase
MDRHLISRAVQEVGELLALEDLTLGTAESCTGGLIASTLTDVSGSSNWFRGAVVAYDNEIKRDVLGVEQGVLDEHGAVSEPVVQAMAQGAAKVLGTDVNVAVSGIAGPTGGTPDKPVGTVWVAFSWPGGTRTRSYRFNGDRDAVKAQTVMAVINGLLSVLR